MSTASQEYSDARGSENPQDHDHRSSTGSLSPADVESLLSNVSVRAALIQARKVQTPEQYENTSRAIRSALARVRELSDADMAASTLNDAFNDNGVQVSASTDGASASELRAAYTNLEVPAFPMTTEQIVARLNFI